MHADALRRSTETGGRKSPATKTVRTASKVLSLVRSGMLGCVLGRMSFHAIFGAKVGCHDTHEGKRQRGGLAARTESSLWTNAAWADAKNV